MRNEFYKECSVILLVYDVTLKRSFDGLDMWIREANDYGAAAIPVAVVANKVNNYLKSIERSSQQESCGRKRRIKLGQNKKLSLL